MQGCDTWRRLLRLATLAAGLVLACAAAPTATAAVLTGVADQRVGFFDQRTYRALDINTVRLTIPWDAGDRPGPWDAWIARAQRDGSRIMLAIQHEDSSSCPAAPCSLPSQDEYGRALAALLAKYPGVREITAWNEPNDRAQPTWRDPVAAAAFYDTARAVCPTCVVVAGDFLDDVSLESYVASYKAALHGSPEVWGLHNYLDAGFFRSTGVDTMLRSTSGRLWLTETGGIVRLTFDDGDVFPYDEKRAADSLEWLYGLTATRPRIERMYLYQWRGTADNHWDSGLLGLNGKPRPSYRVVEEHVARRGGSRPVRHARGTRTATLRFGRRLRFFADGRLEIRARCITRGAGVRRCRQHLLIRVAGRVVARLAADVAPRGAFVRTVRLAGSPRSSLVRGRPGRVGLQTCAWIGHACAGRVTVSVTTPLRPRRSRVAWMSSRRLDRTAG